MKRCQTEKNLAKKRRNLFVHLFDAAGWAPEQGHFRKGRRVADCGQAKCQLCHAYKYPRRKLTRKERLNELDAREHERFGL